LKIPEIGKKKSKKSGQEEIKEQLAIPPKPYDLQYKVPVLDNNPTIVSSKYAYDVVTE
jgi:hypothetical protein